MFSKNLSMCFLNVLTETADKFLRCSGRQLKSLAYLTVKGLQTRFAIFENIALEGDTSHFSPCLSMAAEIKSEWLGTRPSCISMYISQDIVLFRKPSSVFGKIILNLTFLSD